MTQHTRVAVTSGDVTPEAVFAQCRRIIGATGKYRVVKGDPPLRSPHRRHPPTLPQPASEPMGPDVPGDDLRSVRHRLPHPHHEGDPIVSYFDFPEVQEARADLRDALAAANPDLIADLAKRWGTDKAVTA